jgi:hypothetical protein
MENHTQSIPTNQGVLAVRECRCGGIHLCIGGISVNLSRETARYLAKGLNKILGADTKSEMEKNVAGPELRLVPPQASELQ